MTATPTTETRNGVAPPAEPYVRPPHRHWPYVLALFLLLALLGGAAYVVYRTPVLGLHRVSVTARSGELSPAAHDAVTAAVDVPADTPLISIDLEAVRKAALGVPEVATASVSRHWPNGLTIVVTQRSPAAVTSANGALWLLDAAGNPYLKVDSAHVPAGLLPVELATPGTGDRATVAALAVIGELTPAIRSMVASVSARSSYAVTLDLRDGRSVIWGSPGQGAQKAQILPAVLAQPGKTYNISDPGYVSVSN
jgi:cell division protein FtsQ